MARLLSGPAMTGFAAGLIGGMIGSVLYQRQSLRPAAKSVIRSAIGLYERGREAAATLAETASDLVAEIEEERAQAAGAPTPEPRATVTPIKPATAAPSAADA